MRAAEALVRDQFPPNYWPTVATLLRTAYRAADELIRDNPTLQVKSAEDNRGRIIQWSVDLKFEMAIKNGSLPGDYSWEYFDKPTGRYLQFRLSHSTASVSQVHRADRQPRSVVFRENARIRSQSVFEGFDDGAEICGLPHFLIIHGYQNLNFAHIAVPSADSQIDYEFRTQNLMNLPHEVPADPKVAPTEDTDFNPDELGALKVEIERWKRDHDGE